VPPSACRVARVIGRLCGHWRGRLSHTHPCWRFRRDSRGGGVVPSRLQRRTAPQRSRRHQGYPSVTRRETDRSRPRRAARDGGAVECPNGADRECDRVAVRELENDAPRRAIVLRADRPEVLLALTRFSRARAAGICATISASVSLRSAMVLPPLFHQHRDVCVREAKCRYDVSRAHPSRRHYRFVCRTFTSRMSGNCALLIDASRRTVAPSGRRTTTPIPEVSD
jgi:hypothetical protein